MCLFDDTRDQRNYFSWQLIVKCVVYIQLWNLAPVFTMLVQVLGNNAILRWLNPGKFVQNVSEKDHMIMQDRAKLLKKLNLHRQGNRILFMAKWWRFSFHTMCYLYGSWINASCKTKLSSKWTDWTMGNMNGNIEWFPNIFATRPQWVDHNEHHSFIDSNNTDRVLIF